MAEGGLPSTVDASGSINLRAGASEVTSSSGGSIIILQSSLAPKGLGGRVSISGGAGSDTSSEDGGNGGSVAIEGGSPLAGLGGSIRIRGGNCTSNGGAVDVTSRLDGIKLWLCQASHWVHQDIQEIFH